MLGLIAVILGLIIPVDVSDTTLLFHQEGTMPSNGQVIQLLDSVKANKDVQVEARGDGQGDLDCYLLRHNQHGWVLVLQDENKQDSCSLLYTPKDTSNLKLWVINHGTASTKYTITVAQ